MSDVIVRLGVIGDAPVIAEYNRLMAWETEQKVLPSEVVGPGVAKVFADPAKGFYLVAEVDQHVVGQLMVTYEWSDWRDGWFWWIQSVYVQPAYRQQGIFKQLFRAVEAQAKAAGNVVGLRLYVERHNQHAQTTYQRLGMVDSGYLVEELEFAKKS